MSQRPNILGICGSLRKESYNGQLLKLAEDLLKPAADLELYFINEIPLFDGDVEAKGLPRSVVNFRTKIEKADAILISTPEYNYSIPGVLKNAIDWASRPPVSSFKDKPTAIMGASDGWAGTARAQLALRQILPRVGALVMGQPDMYLPVAQDAFTDLGTLKDDKSADRLDSFLDAFIDWIKRVG